MPRADSVLPAEWFAHGDLDIQTAEILIVEDGLLGIAGFHLQQAVEKYLKGFLLSAGHPLRRIHDLEALLEEAIDHDAELAPFLPLCQRITEYYIEARYPLGLTTLFQRKDLQSDLDAVRMLTVLIRKKAGL